MMRKNHIIGLRLSLDEYQQLDSMAKLAGTSLSEFIRQRAVYTDGINQKLDRVLFEISRKTNDIQSLNTQSTNKKGMANNQSIPNVAKEERLIGRIFAYHKTFDHLPIGGQGGFDEETLLVACPSCNNVHPFFYGADPDAFDYDFNFRCIRCNLLFYVSSEMVIDYLRQNHPLAMTAFERKSEEHNIREAEYRKMFEDTKKQIKI